MHAAFLNDRHILLMMLHAWWKIQPCGLSLVWCVSRMPDHNQHSHGIALGRAAALYPPLSLSEPQIRECP